jgi:hypothetical protein
MVKPWDLLNSSVERTTDEVAYNRLSVCRSCEFLIKLTDQCKKCACFMNLKVKINNAVCPEGKWNE